MVPIGERVMATTPAQRAEQEARKQAALAAQKAADEAAAKAKAAEEATEVEEQDEEEQPLTAEELAQAAKIAATQLPIFEAIVKSVRPPVNGKDNSKAFAKFEGRSFSTYTPEDFEEIDRIRKDVDNQKLKDKGDWAYAIIEQWCEKQGLTLAQVWMGPNEAVDYKDPDKPNARPYTYSGKGKVPQWLWINTKADKTKKNDPDKKCNPALLWENGKYKNGVPLKVNGQWISPETEAKNS